MNLLDTLAGTLEPHVEVRRGETLSRHTTFGIGGPADLFVTVRDAGQLSLAVRATNESGVSLFILGSGSNILISDAGIRGVVIDNRARSEGSAADHTFIVESGTSFAAFSRRMCRAGLAGLSWAVGIPGTFGGAVVYNAGAYGGCLADVLVRVELQDDTGEARWYEASELNLVYRGSAFTRGIFSDKAVLRAEITLSEGDAKTLLAEAAAHDGKRLAAQPRGRNAGSMFKNPPQTPAWKLIDAVGLRGATRGDAAVSDLHCNFFVNYGNADAADVAWLVAEAQRRVMDEFGITLEREVAFVGEW